MVRSEGDMSLKNPVTPPGSDPGTIRLVAQRLNHYASPGLDGMLFTICKSQLHVSATNFAHLQVVQ
jgi:hypothetical protein